MQCGPLWPPVAKYGHKPLRCSDFYNLTMAGLGPLRSTDCGSHGRGPRFDPLCAHQKPQRNQLVSELVYENDPR